MCETFPLHSSFIRVKFNTINFLKINFRIDKHLDLFRIRIENH